MMSVYLFCLELNDLGVLLQCFFFLVVSFYEVECLGVDFPGIIVVCF